MVEWVGLVASGFQFISRLAAVFAEVVGGFTLNDSINSFLLGTSFYNEVDIKSYSPLDSNSFASSIKSSGDFLFWHDTHAYHLLI